MSVEVASPTLARVERAIRAVLPVGALSGLDVVREDAVRIDVGGRRFTAEWIGEGWLRDARAALGDAGRKADVLVARRMSPGARSAAAHAGVGWLDESGAAEIVLPGLVISRSGRQVPKVQRPPRWTASVIGTAEALLVGTRPTVADVQLATGLSAGSATKALAALTTLGLLRSEAARGRSSAREIVDRDRLLAAYAEAATARAPALSLRVGIGGRDLIDELVGLGEKWDDRGVPWAATGAAAASVLGPYLGEVAGLDVFVDAPTPATLDSLAERSGLRPMEGGRLVLRPFPTPVTMRLCGQESGLRVAPWPRIYADLRVTGVRGEEAAEHLLEVVGRG
jgi:hypothetical protein